MARIAEASGHPDFGSAPDFTPSKIKKASSARTTGMPSFANLDIDIEAAIRTFWCYFRPQERPSFTPGLLADLAEMQRSLKGLFIGRDTNDPPIRYFVVGSRSPGIFNLGGDLSLFAGLIRSRNSSCLHDYARSCIDVIYDNAVAYSLPIVTIAMVQGDALGGGFEAALSCNIIVAERSARFGLPEVLFNLFPGMGAYSFLSRRLGPMAAEKMIVSGRVYEAAELHAMGLVDILVEDGEAPAAVRSYIVRHGRRHYAEQSVYRVGRRVNPIEYRELSDVIAIWVEAALRLSEHDLRKMERIMSAQNRRWAMLPPHSVAI
jgi:DSF synthase